MYKYISPRLKFSDLTWTWDIRFMPWIAIIKKEIQSTVKLLVTMWFIIWPVSLCCPQFPQKGFFKNLFLFVIFLLTLKQALVPLSELLYNTQFSIFPGCGIAIKSALLLWDNLLEVWQKISASQGAWSALMGLVWLYRRFRFLRISSSMAGGPVERRLLPLRAMWVKQWPELCVLRHKYHSCLVTLQHLQKPLEE